MTDPLPEPLLTLVSTREALSPAETLQLEAELDALHRRERIEHRIWQALVWLFGACAGAMTVRTIAAIVAGRFP